MTTAFQTPSDALRIVEEERSNELLAKQRKVNDDIEKKIIEMEAVKQTISDNFNREKRYLNETYGDRKLSDKQKRFVQAIATGKKLADAMEESKVARKMADLDRNYKVNRKMNEMQIYSRDTVCQEFGITAEFITDKALTALKMAQEREKPLEMVACLKLMMDLHGLNSPQQQAMEVNAVVNSQHIKLQALSDDELKEIVRLGNKITGGKQENVPEPAFVVDEKEDNEHV